VLIPALQAHGVISVPILATQGRIVIGVPTHDSLVHNVINVLIHDSRARNATSAPTLDTLVRIAINVSPALAPENCAAERLRDRPFNFHISHQAHSQWDRP
jgi:hypothetical protein